MTSDEFACTTANTVLLDGSDRSFFELGVIVQSKVIVTRQVQQFFTISREIRPVCITRQQLTVKRYRLALQEIIFEISQPGLGGIGIHHVANCAQASLRQDRWTNAVT